MLPTRLMMMKSSLKMMRIQPKVDALKRKYAHLKVSDPKRAEMNTEMMALYKQENVNMYGGCLPLLIQMPLFFAYYRVLANVIELRQAHWYWLTISPCPTRCTFCPSSSSPACSWCSSSRHRRAWIRTSAHDGHHDAGDLRLSMWHFASGLALYWGTGNLINLASS
jgi:YidC/Oxa1 family membrane protein insertase